MTKTITVGPFSAFFFNVNREMGLPGHSHFAQITLEFRTNGDGHGFPAFGETYKAIQDHIIKLTEKPFRDATNEVVADRLYEAFTHLDDERITKWGGDFTLVRMTLSVRGVPDKIGHADGFTDYTVRA